MTGCHLLVRPTRRRRCLAGGRTRGQIPIPANPGLVGASFHLQILENEPFANPAGAVLSNAGRDVIGLR
ncbi:MAG TPA: hypothetical protein VK081_00750 [Planctomycetota bacterium]|nr:hypothetical protein [Planctomycetota bacterium]